MAPAYAAPSDFDCIVSGYHLTQTALLQDPYCCKSYQISL